VNSPVLRTTAIALGLALGTGAMAQTPAEAQAAASAATKKKGADARSDADSAKRDADYAAAREKCNVFAGEVKASCVGNAKARFDRR
jgi:hypothetical protein